MENTLNINVPEGYEIDKEKSMFDNIVFKKLPLQEMVSIKWNNWYNGVEIKADGEHFVISANPSYHISWNEAMRFYGNPHKSHTWVLPSMEQLEILAKYRDTVNQIMRKNKGFEIFNCLWSYREKNECCAWYFNIDSGYPNDLGKGHNHYVRPVVNL